MNNRLHYTQMIQRKVGDKRMTEMKEVEIWKTQNCVTESLMIKIGDS